MSHPQPDPSAFETTVECRYVRPVFEDDTTLVFRRDQDDVVTGRFEILPGIGLALVPDAPRRAPMRDLRPVMPPAWLLLLAFLMGGFAAATASATAIASVLLIV